jgi:hypothetical protein
MLNSRLMALKEQIDLLNSDLGSGNLLKIRREQEALEKEIATLKIEIQSSKKSGMIEINERERAKIYAIKKLSEEMDYKVKETQANLMALNEEQLQTTTRLTIL